MAVSKNTTLPKAVAEASPQQHCFSREVGFSAAFWPGANARRKRCSCTSGNLTQDDLYKFKYDAEHRLVEIRNLSNLLISSYAFDGHSLRVIKVWGADRTWYIYAGTQLVSEFEDAASATYSSPTAPGSLPSDSVSTVLYQHGDHLTTRLTTDQQGQVSNQQAHYPYGEQWYAAGGADASVERKFTSYLKDAEVATGKLNYAIYREQSGRTGRFLRPDPDQGDGAELNRYAYVGNDPANYSDAAGLRREMGGNGPGSSGGLGFGDGFTRGAFNIHDTFPVHGIGPGGSITGPPGSLRLVGGGGGGSGCASGGSDMAGGGVVPCLPPPPPPPQRSTPDCFARLLYRPVSVPGAVYNHAFWWVRDERSQNFVISGGPTGPGCTGELRVWETRGIVSRRFPEDNVWTATWHWTSNRGSASCEGVRILRIATLLFNPNHVAYQCFGPNSNTAARWLGN